MKPVPILLIGTMTALAQGPAFDVASVKPNDPSKRPGVIAGIWDSTGRINRLGSLQTFIKQAYGVEDVQISGGPGWLDYELFDIEARMSPAAGPEQIKLMLQTLLAERFKLVLHTTTKDLPSYSLVVAKTGLKLQPADENGGFSSGPNLLRGTVDMRRLAIVLTPVLGRTVTDESGLKGLYKVALAWSDDGPSLSTALEEQAGLRLESVKRQVQVLIIDSAARPSAN